MGDFIQTFLTYTESVPSPEIFRLWSAISCVAGALERRVWAQVLPRPTYANMFITLVAVPGVGKGVIEETAHLWRKAKGSNKRAIFHIAPDSVTSAALLLSLKDASRVIIRDGILLDEYHNLLVAAEELGVLLPAHDLEFLSRLNYIFNNPPILEVRRAYIEDVISIVNPQLNILAGTQPGYLASLLPEEAWSMGFTARLIMIYAGSGPKARLFQEHASREDLERTLVAKLCELSELYGHMRWEPSAAELLINWDAGGCLPRPEHARLLPYNNRRTQYVIKLAMVSALSRENELVIRRDDIIRAFDWLFPAEALMPDIFREMVHRSDTQVLQELHFFMWKEHIKTKKPLHEARLFNFLAQRVPSDKITRLIEVAERSNMLARSAGTSTYTPRPQTDWGLDV